MLMTVSTTLSVFLLIHTAAAIPGTDYITDYKDIIASSTFNHDFSVVKVVDKKSGTLPDVCNCCWASTLETNPSIQLLLHQPTVIGFIEIIGRTNSITEDIQRLSGIHILIDGQNRDTYQHYDYTNNKVTIRMPAQRASNITINRPMTTVNWFLTICEIKVYPVRNIAGRATVTASSTLTYAGTVYKADYVKDGSNQTLPDTCNCCWSSQNEFSPNIELLLNTAAPVVFIEIIGRTDQVNSVQRTLTGTNVITDGADWSRNQTMTGNNIYLSVSPLTPVHNITVVRPRPDGRTEWFLIICEIRVFSFVSMTVLNVRNVVLVEKEIYACDNTTYKHLQNMSQVDYHSYQWRINTPVEEKSTISGCLSDHYYGDNCTVCGQCLNGNTCNNITGECSNGCEAGYMPPTCSAVCTSGTFGRNCSETCSPHCFASCNTVSGICIQGCMGGFMGPYCNSSCNKGNYGVNCTNQCSMHCTGGNNNCETVNGACTAGCLPGYTGVKCDQVCTSGTFGRNCSDTCSPNCYASCNTVSGICIRGCKAGFMGPYCNTSCNEGNYGVNCTNSCSVHCMGGYSNCDAVNGACKTGCMPGFTGVKCDKDCPVTYYGVNCSQHCSSHCKQSHCDKITGACSDGCIDGYLEQYCNETCSAGKYGPDCTQTCGSCKDDDACINTNGVCENGCESGYNGTTCKPCPVGYYGDGCGKRCHCNNGVDCLKNNGSCPHGCEFGWSGDSCSIDLNIISGDGLNTFVNQSSVFKGNTPSYGPHNAIDRIENYDIDTCGCCSVTNQLPSWWQINLGQQYLIHALQIYGRSSGSEDQLQNATIYAGNVSLTLTQQDGVAIYTVPQMDTVRHFTKILDAAIIAQYFLVKLDQHILTLCEFKLFKQVCEVGRFGVGCSHTCHCYDNQTCYSINGNCQTPGCYPGWNGISCDQECTSPAFGEMCTDICHCINGTHCDHVTGHCDVGECDPGWQGESCNQECVSSAFGAKCNSTCNCINGTTCDHVTGHCDLGECDPGWEGESCNQECVSLAFGTKCNNTCHCINGTHCDHVTGHCDIRECEPGWQGESCSQGCVFPAFGANCTDTCHCINKTHCDHVTGYCDQGECAPGWQGDSCNQECVSPEFGNNCTDICHCINRTQCDHVTGHCNSGECDSGWQGESCNQECVSPAFGTKCHSTCHCINGTRCDHVTGHCDLGECQSGWQGESCNQGCVFPAFGNNCSLICHCINGTHCDHITGHCMLEECELGWQGSSCNQECDSPAFGDKCNSSCHCINGTHCDHVGGHCEIGECDPGWRGESCNQVCASSTFGESCRSTCYCASKSQCDHITGQCDVGKCDPGWQGDSCSQVLESVGSDTSSNTPAIAGGVVAAVLVIAIIVVILVLYRRKKGFGKQANKDNTDFTNVSQPPRVEHKPSQGNINHSYEETQFDGGGDYYSFGPSVGIKRQQLWGYIRDKMENKCAKFFEEFKKVPYGLQHDCKDARHPDNMGKNRYREMYAYDHSRVKLEVTGPDEGDYINACYINGFDKVKKFVASQGPWKNMVHDFWRLAWQINTDKIVMLTNLIELGSTKCLQYWPDDGEENYGNVCVKLVRTETYLDYNIRHLSVSMEGEPARKIRQFHFKSWPDKDVPDSTWCLVHFWRAVNTNEVTGAGPLLVHCSAGVGRTGTFIALDNLMSQSKTEGCIRPLQMVQSLREQRVNMVQTKEQYVYLHEAVADALFIGTHDIWTKQFQEVYTFLLHHEKGATESRLEFQYNLIERGLDETAPDSNGVELYSNVSTLGAISDAHKPRLQKTGTVIAPQLGAIYMQNYNGKNSFILTHSPTKSTIDEFLTLIAEHNIKTVLMLTDESSPSYKESCQLQTSGTGSRFTVNKIDEHNRDTNLVEQSFSYKLKHEGEENLSTIKQFRYLAWKDNRQVPDDTASFIEYLEAVLRWQPHLSESQPVLIHCGDGQNRSGLTYVVLNEISRIKMDGSLNIVDTVTKMKQRSRQMVAGYEQYQYCHDALLAFIDQTQTQIYSNL